MSTTELKKDLTFNYEQIICLDMAVDQELQFWKQTKPEDPFYNIAQDKIKIYEELHDLLLSGDWRIEK